MSKISKKIKSICKNITLKLENNSDIMALSYKEWRWKDEKLKLLAVSDDVFLNGLDHVIDINNGNSGWTGLY